jgi:hypothetical protein
MKARLFRKRELVSMISALYGEMWDSGQASAAVTLAQDGFFISFPDS